MRTGIPWIDFCLMAGLALLLPGVEVACLILLVIGWKCHRGAEDEDLHAYAYPFFGSIAAVCLGLLFLGVWQVGVMSYGLWRALGLH